MRISQGMTIKIFPDTSVKAYQKFIKEYGFTSTVYKDRIVVGEPLRQIDRRELGELIKRKRARKKMTRTDLAARLQIREVTVFDYENGTTQPRKDIMEDLKKILNIKEEEIKKCQR